MRIVLERVGLVGVISLNRRLYLGFPFRLLRIYAAQDGTINRTVRLAGAGESAGVDCHSPRHEVQHVIMYMYLTSLTLGGSW